MKKLFAMLLALCMMCGMVSAGAEGAMREVELYGSWFEIPSELVTVEEMSGVRYAYLFASAEDYELEMSIQDYALVGLNLEENPATEQLMNVLYWLIDMGLDAEAATDVALAHELLDIGMPDGKPVACLSIGSGVSIGHTDDNYGFFITLATETGKSTDEMLEIGIQIALSFQRGGAEETVAEAVAVNETATEEPEAEEAPAAEETSAAEEAAPTQFIVITGDSANIRSGPGSDHSKVATARKGDTFPMLGQEGTWYKIEVNGQEAYVAQGLCKVKE